MSVRPPGAAFQEFVAVLERGFSADAHTTVEAVKRIRDRVTGRLREFDVLITFRKDHNEVVSAIECRDYKRKLDVSHVEAFKTKMQDCGVHRGVMVSAAGFTSNALAKAAANSIGCMTLEQAMSADWLASQSLPIHHRQITVHGHRYAVPGCAGLLEPYVAYADNGQPITEAGIRGRAIQMLAEPDDAELGGEPVRYELVDEPAGFYVVDARGDRYDITAVHIYAEVTNEVSELPVEAHSYVGQGREYSVASADWTRGPWNHKVVLIKEGDQVRYGIVPREA